MMQAGRYLAIIGLDGAGKTSVIRRLILLGTRQGKDVKYVWFRFSHLASLVPLTLARLTRATTVINGQRIHRFSGHRLISFFYPRLLYVDMRIAGFFRIKIPLKRGRAILLDRCPVDAIVDLAIDLGDPGFIRTGISDLICGIMPEESGLILFLDTQLDTIRMRCPRLSGDQTLEKRQALYRELIARLGIPSIENQTSISETADTISERFMEWRQ